MSDRLDDEVEGLLQILADIGDSVAHGVGYEDQVKLYQGVFLTPYNAAIRIGGDPNTLNHGLLTAGIEAAMATRGPGPAAAWLRQLADEIEAQYPPDASRH